MPKEIRSLTQERLGCLLGVDSEGDALDDASGDAPSPSVVELGGGRVGVPGQVLDVLERHILAQQVRDHQDAERVGREDLRQAGGLQPPLPRREATGDSFPNRVVRSLPRPSP